jgi:hypothetical protein
MTFEEFAATRMPGLLRFAAVLAGDRATAEDLAMGGRFSETNAEDRPHSIFTKTTTACSSSAGQVH